MKIAIYHWMTAWLLDRGLPIKRAPKIISEEFTLEHRLSAFPKRKPFSKPTVRAYFTRIDKRILSFCWVLVSSQIIPFTSGWAQSTGQYHEIFVSALLVREDNGSGSIYSLIQYLAGREADIAEFINRVLVDRSASARQASSHLRGLLSPSVDIDKLRVSLKTSPYYVSDRKFEITIFNKLAHPKQRAYEFILRSKEMTAYIVLSTDGKPILDYTWVSWTDSF